MDALQTKRPTHEANRVGRTTSVYQGIDSELQRKLVSVGARARKHVSEGHLTRGTSIPSFNGLTVGTLDQAEIRQQQDQSYMGARYSQSTSSIPAPYYMTNDSQATIGGTKRSRSTWEASTGAVELRNDEEYGDTEEDEETFDPSRQNLNLNPWSANTISSSFSVSNDYNSHTTFFPHGHRTKSSNMDDFEEANFLRPQQT